VFAAQELLHIDQAIEPQSLHLKAEKNAVKLSSEF